MKKIYVDNGSTSFPKAPGVSCAMKDFLDNVGCNVNRGGYESSYTIAMEIIATRKLLCDMFNFDNPRNVVFTPGVTYSLNMLIRGFLKKGDHVVTTPLEHNSVLRTLHDLTVKGVITYDIAKCDNEGNLDVENLKGLINSRTKAVVLTHASNVCGTIVPIGDVGQICKRYGIKLIIDAAQTAGVLDIDMKNIDVLAFTAHKGFLAAQGLGGFVITDDMADKTATIITGGTGSSLNDMVQSDRLPDKFEMGTINIPAIIGLKRALEYINSVGVGNIYEKEMELAGQFINGIKELKDINIIGKKDVEGRTAVVSLDFAGRDNAEIAAALDTDYGIMTRTGLHCSPISHRTLGTYPKGTVRFSFGHFNTAEEVDYILKAVKALI